MSNISPASQRRKDSDSRNKAIVQQKAEERAILAARRAAGLAMPTGREKQADADWRRQCEVMPSDTRSLTGRIFGDPVKGDPRTPWRG